MGYHILMCIHSHLGDEENETCSVCGSRYGDDSERMKKTWIGCDGIQMFGLQT